MKRWARFISRTAWVWIVIWPIVDVAVWAPAPRAPTLLEDDATGLLPSDMRSQRANDRGIDQYDQREPVPKLWDRLSSLSVVGRGTVARRPWNARWRCVHVDSTSDAVVRTQDSIGPSELGNCTTAHRLPSGLHTNGSVGPKTAIVRTPARAATCVIPASWPM